MNKKKFTLIELIVVIAILGILASLIIPNIASFKGDATVTAIASNVRNFQTAVDMYSLKNNSEYPTASQPTEFIPEPIDFNKLDKKYLKTLPKTEGVKYWVDFQGRVWASTIDAPQKVVNASGNITWEAVTGAVKYQVFEVQGYQGVISTLVSSKSNLVLKGETTTTTYSGEENKYYVVNAIDEQNFQTAPAGLNYKGYVLPSPSGEQTEGGIQTTEPIKHKPIATINMNQEQGLLTTTNIIFNYTFIDEDNDTITQTEWQIDSKPVQTTAPNGNNTEGNHIIKLRIQDISGLWSDWTEKQFYVINPNGIKQIKAGYDHTLIVKEDNSLWGFGNNAYSQLGVPTTGLIITPVKIMDSVSKVSAGHAYTMIIKTDNSLWAVGQNMYSRFGNAIPSGTNKTSTPVKVMDDVLDVSANTSHTMILKRDNTLWGLGTNRYGEIGVPNNFGSDVEINIPIKVMDNVSKVSTGRNFTLVLTTDNSVWSFGQNQQGQLGNGTTNNTYTPVKILTGVKDIDTGFYHSLVIKEDNSLWSFGYNYRGQLGVPNNHKTSNPNPTPIKVMDNVLKISSWYEHTLVLKEDYTLYSFGKNPYGELGTNVKLGDDYGNATPVKIMDNVSDISTGKNYSIVMKSDKTIYGFGFNRYAQLGNATNNNTENPNANPVQIVLP